MPANSNSDSSLPENPFFKERSATGTNGEWEKGEKRNKNGIHGVKALNGLPPRGVATCQVEEPLLTTR